MSGKNELSFLDKLEILEIIFPVAYTTDYANHFQPEVARSISHYIEVEKGIRIGCRFFTINKKLPSILYFHGNGETALDQDWLSVFYLNRGINFFAADYRGYGVSNGKPTVSNLTGDSRKIYKGLRKIINEEGYNPDLFVMGRSLGSIPAVEIAHHFQNELKGLIIESGAAGNFTFLSAFLSPAEAARLNRSHILNKEKIKSITIPTLIIHGERDQIIPVEEGKELYENSGAREKSITLIPYSGHNDLLINGEEQYFTAIEKFVKSRMVSG